MYDSRHRRRRRRGPLPVSWVLLLVFVTGSAAFGYEYRAELAAVVRGDATISVATPSPSASLSPSPSPSPSPADDPVPRPRKRRLVIHGTGDVNLDPSYIPALAANGYRYAWSGLDGLFREDDLTVVNLECPVSNRGTIIPKEFNFRCDPDALPAARRAGVEVANLGNNHAYDYGPEALLDSLRHLREARIESVGAGRDKAAAMRPAVLRIKGWRVGVLGFGLVVDPFPQSVAGRNKPGVAGGHDTAAMVEAIRRLERRADLTVVTIHWGIELFTEPTAEQVALGRRFVRAGADIVFGHHAHRLQPLEIVRGKPVFWGLGNFVWPNFSHDGSVTGVARVVVDPDGDLHARILPAFIEAAGHPVLRRRG